MTLPATINNVSRTMIIYKLDLFINSLVFYTAIVITIPMFPKLPAKVKKNANVIRSNANRKNVELGKN